MSKLNFFDSLFDFNHDGKLGAFEMGAKIGAIAHFMSESKDDTTFDAGYSTDAYCDDDDDFETDLDEGQMSELEMAGIDVDELEFMDEDERREALEDAGLDPDDYDS